MQHHNYNFKRLKPKVVADLVRLGNEKHDGGYILSKRQIGMTKVLLGLGINYDWTFEEDFRRENEECEIYCYDFSVGKKIYLKALVSSLFGLVSLSNYTKEIFNQRSPLSVLSKPFLILSTYMRFSSFFNSRKHNHFIQKGVSNVDYGSFVSVKKMFADIPMMDSCADNSFFIKMDIEQSEYDILEDVLIYSSKINGMVVEFHDLRHFWTDFSYLIDKITESFEVIHVHGNNCDGPIPGTTLPNFVEVTFMKKDLLTKDELEAINERSYPTELDRANVPFRPDVPVSFN
jgi:hypothetical protein